jgi:hypothetical protein
LAAGSDESVCIDDAAVLAEGDATFDHRWIVHTAPSQTGGSRILQ